MVTTRENMIDDISKKLGEPGFFSIWRKEMSSKSAEKTIDTSYGLSISVDQKNFEDVEYISEPVYSINAQEGVQVYSWSEAMLDEGVCKSVANLFEWATPQLFTDFLSAENASMFASGQVVTVGRGQQGKLSLSSVLSSATADVVCVIVGDEATLSFIDDIVLENTILNRTVLVQVGKNSSVEYIQSRKGEGSSFVTLLSKILSSGELSFVDLSTAIKGVTKIRSEHSLEEEYARVQTAHIAVVAGDGVVDIFDSARHNASHTKSLLDASGISMQKGKIVYRSDIIMNTKNTTALSGAQKARFLIRSKDAEVDAIPSLDISQKDVSCSHSVSISHMKETDTYYARLRGMDAKQAEEMVVEGLLIAPVKKVKERNVVLENIQKALEDYIL